MHVDASSPGHSDATAAGSLAPPTRAQQWRTAVLWLGLTIVCCASLYPFTRPGPRWLAVLARSAWWVSIGLRDGIPCWILLIIARLPLPKGRRLGLFAGAIGCFAFDVWTSPERQWTDATVTLIMSLIWLTLSITPWWVWRGALPGKPAQYYSLEQRVHSLARASLWLFAFFGLLGRTIPWFDLVLISDAQIMHLGWSSVGAYAAALSIRARRPDLVSRSMFALLVPISIFLFNVSFSALGLR